MKAFKPVVLCRRPPNHAFEGSVQQRSRCWVPSSLRSSAPPHLQRPFGVIAKEARVFGTVVA